MKKIVALGASNSKESINKKLASYVANKITNSTLNILDLNDYITFGYIENVKNYLKFIIFM